MLFDTDVLIWAIRGLPAAATLIDEDKQRFVSVVNYMELMQGARNKQEQTHLKHFFKSLNFTVLPINEAISHHAAFLIEAYTLKSGIQLADALVFATAHIHSLTLCSANEKHFRDIDMLNTFVFRPNA